MFLVFAVQALFGIATILNKQLLFYTSPFILTPGRLFLSGGLWLGYLWYRDNITSHVKTKKNIVYIFILCSLFYFYHVLKYWALQHMSPTKMSLLITTSPCITSLLSSHFTQKKFRTIQWMMILLALIGSINILLLSSPEEVNIIALSHISWAEIAVTLSIIIYSIYILFFEFLVKKYNYSSSLLYTTNMFTGGTFGIIPLFITKENIYINNPYNFFILFFILILISNIISSPLYYLMLKKHSASLLTLSDCLGPLFVTFYSYLFFGDIISFSYLLSGLLIIIGTGGFYYYDCSKYSE